MDNKTQKVIEKFKKDPAAAQSLLQSGDGQRLMQLLIVHNLLYFAQQVILGYQCIYIHHHDVFP